MNTRVDTLKKWIPAIAVTAIIALAGFLYRSELIEWFSPLVRSDGNDRVVASLAEGSAGKDMEGSMTKPGADATIAAHQIAAGPFHIGVTWEPTPPREGENTLAVHVADASGHTLEGASVHVKVDDGLVELREDRPGLYRSGVHLPEQGAWKLVGDVRTVDLRHADFIIEFTTGEPDISVAPAMDHAVHDDNGEIAYWTCSMHPSVRADDPGICPICAMQLTPVTRHEVETGVIMVDAQRRQLIGVKTDTVRRESIVKTLRTVGTLLVDETRVEDVSLKIDAWIGAVDADFTGQHVRRGQRLFSFYSPELWSAQEEYVETVQRSHEYAGRTNRLMQVAETRLRLWGIDDATIASIREKGEPVEYLPFLSPANGVVMEKSVFEGTAVKAGERLYRIADLSTLWVEAEIYENEVPLVELGQTAEITLSYLPDQVFTGEISYIYPYLNQKTRTARIRIDVPNPDGTLKPSMYTNVNLRIPLGERLVVPESAII